MDQYVSDVILRVPRKSRKGFELRLRERIERGLRDGKGFEQVSAEMGKPDAVAQTMLALDEFRDVRYAGLLRRVPAMVLDLILCALLVAPGLGLSIALAEESGGHPVPVLMLLGSLFGSFLIVSAYFCLSEHNSGATLGKRIMGIKVARENGQPLSLRKSFLRLVFFFPPLILPDLLVSLFNGKGRRLSDFMVGTVVLQERG